MALTQLSTTVFVKHHPVPGGGPPCLSFQLLKPSQTALLKNAPNNRRAKIWIRGDIFKRNETLVLYMSTRRFLGLSEPELSLLLHAALIMVPEALSGKWKPEYSFWRSCVLPWKVCFAKLISFGSVSSPKPFEISALQLKKAGVGEIISSSGLDC